MLSDISGGAIFDIETDGGQREAICTVTIVNDDHRAKRFAKALQILRMDLDPYRIADRFGCTRDYHQISFAVHIGAVWVLLGRYYS